MCALLGIRTKQIQTSITSHSEAPTERQIVWCTQETYFHQACRHRHHGKRGNTDLLPRESSYRADRPKLRKQRSPDNVHPPYVRWQHEPTSVSVTPGGAKPRVCSETTLRRKHAHNHSSSYTRQIIIIMKIHLLEPRLWFRRVCGACTHPHSV